MHALVTAAAATLPLVVIFMVVQAITSKSSAAGWLFGSAATVAFMLTVAAANVYASQSNDSGMWVWYVVLAFVAMMFVFPAAAANSSNSDD